jgi:uncharacterized protein YeaO (DUF488 family)
MPRIRTKRWNDPVEPDDGRRLLVCRYRPRGVRKEAETWDAWLPNLGPSRELHADYYGKHGPPISLGEYRRRYLAEMRGQQRAIATWAAWGTAGETITLLCSSACVDPARCHRTLLKELIESHVGLRRAPTLARQRALKRVRRPRPTAPARP